jgi:2-oxoglutarate/2-oxoacid ferredoxin oxidoreductase subunit beta
MNKFPTLENQKKKKISTSLNNLIQKADQYHTFTSPNKMTWCSGCGNFGIFSAINRALVLEEILPYNVLMCFDVGCNGNGSDKINSYTIHGLHGRSTALAPACAMTNRKMTVIATGGDGSTFSEGINHLIHAVRNNYKMVFICHNNNNYGLTTGQASSTTKPGNSMNSSPEGNLSEQLNSLQLVLSLNPSWVGRSFSGNINHMTKMIREAINHQGFAYLEIMQACPTYNKFTPQEWYWDKIVDVENLKLEQNYDNTDIWQARRLVDDLDNKLAIGLIYHNPNMQDYLSKTNRGEIQTELVEEVRQYDISQLLGEFV